MVSGRQVGWKWEVEEKGDNRKRPTPDYQFQNSLLWWPLNLVATSSVFITIFLSKICKRCRSLFLAITIDFLPGEWNGNPIQYSFPKNSMDKGFWQAMVHWIAKSQKWLSDWHSVDFLFWYLRLKFSYSDTTTPTFISHCITILQYFLIKSFYIVTLEGVPWWLGW